VTGVGGCETLTHKNVAQVSAASSALHFDSMAVRIWQVLHCAFHFFIKGRPTAMGVKLVNGPV
jgi:hypothetical protein